MVLSCRCHTSQSQSIILRVYDAAHPAAGVSLTICRAGQHHDLPAHNCLAAVCVWLFMRIAAVLAMCVEQIACTGSCCRASCCITFLRHPEVPCCLSSRWSDWVPPLRSQSLSSVCVSVQHNHLHPYSGKAYTTPLFWYGAQHAPALHAATASASVHCLCNAPQQLWMDGFFVQVGQLHALVFVCARVLLCALVVVLG